MESRLWRHQSRHGGSCGAFGRRCDRRTSPHARRDFRGASGERGCLMHATPAFRSGWTIARSMWLARQPAFVGLVAAPLLCGWLFHLAPASFLSRESAGTLGKLLMGLSLFLTFICCNFTENDRRERLDGFPARLFTLPVATVTLVAAPLLFSALVIAGIYVGWA